MAGERLIFLAPTLAELDRPQSIRATPIRQIPESTSSSKRSNSSMTMSLRPPKRQKISLEHLAGPYLSKLARVPKSDSTFRRPSNTCEQEAVWQPAEKRNEKGSFADQLNNQASAMKDQSTGSLYACSPSPNHARGEDEVSLSPPNMAESSAPVSVSKQTRVRLMPARKIGISRTMTDKKPLLKRQERLDQPAKSTETSQRPLRPGLRPVLNQHPDDISGGATTIQSIPPPPPHAFELSRMTSISTIVSSPDSFLSCHQGGNHPAMSMKFSLLALIMRVSELEDTPDYKLGNGQTMDCCEVLVRDASNCALKVVLQGDCARRWAAPRAQQSACSDPKLPSEPESNSCNLSWDASFVTDHDGSTSASRSTTERWKDASMLPIRAGDVVVFSNLLLRRPQFKRQRRLSQRSNNQPAVVLFATASPLSEAHMELCWRNDVRTGLDGRRNFDECLTAFDARCKAIYRLAQSCDPTH